MRKQLLFVQLLFLTLLSSTTFAQNSTVTGTVTDNAGAPVPGVTVTEKGTSNATATNDVGLFSISVGRDATLTFSGVGYTSKDLKVSGNTLDVSLASSNQALDEVVVTALGIKKEKKALGYSVTEVKGDELTQARTPNIANSLVGKVAGLNITSTATGSGGSSRITIRGNASISGQNQPLIVVDGIPINNDNLGSVGMWGGADKGDGISSLNPDEIETVSVLKGGTAAALYGSRASNGAILVTTKTGKRNGSGVGIEINSNYVAEDLLYKKFKDYQYEYGTGDNGVKPASSDPNLNQTNSFGGKLDGSSVPQYDGVSRPYSAQKDNQTKFYDIGTAFTNSIAISGGSEKMLARFSLSNMDNKSVIPNSTLKRQNYAINLSGALSKKLSYVGNVKYIREKTRNRPRVSDSPGNAVYSLWTLPTSLDVETMKGDNKYTETGFERVWSNNQYVQNPYYATEDFQQNDSKDRIITSIEPRYNITDWLFVKGRAGFDKFNYRNTEITPTGTGFQLGGGYNNFQRDFIESNLELILGLNKKITNAFDLSAIVGGNRMKQVYNDDSYGGGPFNIPFFYQISNINPGSRNTSYSYREKRINSVFGSVDLSYNNFLFLNVTGRNDWFSTLSLNDNAIFYPSVGLSFVLSEAVTMPQFVNYFKVRGSWAQTGGDTDPYQLNLNYGLTGAHLGSPLAQINQSQVPNSLLKPYQVTASEIGLEGRLLNNRMSFDIALYDRKTKDDIVSASISGASGYGSALFNVGQINNKGIEALITYQFINQKNFSWETSLNFAYNKSEVVSLYGDLTKLQVDEPRPRSAYIFQEVGKAFADIQAISFLRNDAGQIVYNSQGLPIADGLKSYGTGISPVTAGINNTFRFGAVSVSFLIDGKFGGKIFSGTNALAYRYGLHKETLPGREGGVVGAGVDEDNKANAVNVPAQNYYGNLYNFGEPFIYSSDFIKLRQLIVDYMIPSKAFGKTPFKGASIGLVARNLWTIMKRTPIIDPESTYNNGNAQGLEFAGMPITRTIGVNLNLKF